MLPVSPRALELVPALVLVLSKIINSALVLLLPVIPGLIAVIYPLLPIGIPVLASLGPIGAIFWPLNGPLAFSGPIIQSRSIPLSGAISGKLAWTVGQRPSDCSSQGASCRCSSSYAKEIAKIAPARALGRLVAGSSPSHSSRASGCSCSCPRAGPGSVCSGTGWKLRWARSGSC